MRFLSVLVVVSLGCASEVPGPEQMPGSMLTPAPQNPAEVPAEVTERIRSRDAYCSGTGAPIVVPGPNTNATCTGALAERLFRYAVCTCENVTAAVSGFRTSAFDSRGGMPGDDESGAAVGINTTFGHVGGLDIGGSLTVAGSEGFASIGAGLEIRGDLKTNGDYRFAGGSHIARSAWVGGLSGVGQLTIGGDLYGTSPGLFVEVAGAVDPTPVAVESPCACGDDEILDVGAVVADALDNNHNADVDLAPDALVNLIGHTERELPCGRFYLDGIGGIGSLTLRIEGRTALFIGGNVDAVGGINVELGPEGELDIFVAGSMRLVGAAQFGSPDRPAATRIYVGGEGEIALAGAGDFVGNLYAPRAPVRTVGAAEVYGSVFAKQLFAAGEVSVHYDRAIQHAGDECIIPPPEVCYECGDCAGGAACIDGACGACQNDGDCCGPLVCDPGSGRCGHLLI